MVHLLLVTTSYFHVLVTNILLSFPNLTFSGSHLYIRAGLPAQRLLAAEGDESLCLAFVRCFVFFRFSVCFVFLLMDSFLNDTHGYVVIASLHIKSYKNNQVMEDNHKQIAVAWRLHDLLRPGEDTG